MYLYVFEFESSGKSEHPPTDEDIRSVENGVLQVFNMDDNTELTQSGDWVPIQEAKITSGEEAGDFHYVPNS